MAFNETEDCIIEDMNYTLGGDNPGFLDINHTSNIIFSNFSLNCSDECYFPNDKTLL